MKTVTADIVAQALEEAIPRLACVLPADVHAALIAARDAEADARGRAALEVLCSNAELAAGEMLPLCQDTGTVRVALEVGPGVCVAGDVFARVDEVVSHVYTARGLRASVVRDALCDRANTTDNTPAFCEVELTGEPGAARLHVMLKGGGSDNACRVVMLPPSAGRAGIVAEVVRCVREKAANACPPLTIGVGVGGTFDSVASLASRALRRAVDEPASTPELAAFEDELAAAVRATGIGAAALGGAATALAVHVETAPCHIAALPLAIEMGCCALRRCTIDLNHFAGEGEAADGVGHGLAASSARAGKSGELSVRAQDCLSPRGHAACRSEEPVRLQLPLTEEAIAGLKAGDTCLLTGEMFTLRDAGHARLVAELDARGADHPLPYGLEGATIFYAGPTPASPTHPERPFGAVGPTTASRMDAFAPRLYAAGVRATIGKGSRSAEVARACAEHGAVYFSAIGGAAALLGSCVESAETVAYDDLGTEALRRLVVRDLLVTVAIDAAGCAFSPAAAASGPAPTAPASPAAPAAACAAVAPSPESPCKELS